MTRRLRSEADDQPDWAVLPGKPRSILSSVAGELGTPIVSGLIALVAGVGFFGIVPMPVNRPDSAISALRMAIEVLPDFGAYATVVLLAAVFFSVAMTSWMGFYWRVRVEANRQGRTEWTRVEYNKVNRRASTILVLLSLVVFLGLLVVGLRR